MYCKSAVPSTSLPRQVKKVTQTAGAGSGKTERWTKCPAGPGAIDRLVIDILREQVCECFLVRVNAGPVSSTSTSSRAFKTYSDPTNTRHTIPLLPY